MAPGRRRKRPSRQREESEQRHLLGKVCDSALLQHRLLVGLKKEGKDGNGGEATKTGWSQGVKSFECSAWDRHQADVSFKRSSSPSIAIIT